MTDKRRSRLEAAGIDTAQALERMMGSEALLERLLDRFLEDRNFPSLAAALECGDADGAVQAAHTLKGVCGNLSMNGLYRLFTRQVELLREGDLTRARAMMEEIAAGYHAVAGAIRGREDEGR